MRQPGSWWLCMALLFLCALATTTLVWGFDGEEESSVEDDTALSEEDLRALHVAGISFVQESALREGEEEEPLSLQEEDALLQLAQVNADVSNVLAGMGAQRIMSGGFPMAGVGMPMSPTGATIANMGVSTAGMGSSLMGGSELDWTMDGFGDIQDIAQMAIKNGAELAKKFVPLSTNVAEEAKKAGDEHSKALVSGAKIQGDSMKKSAKLMAKQIMNHAKLSAEPYEKQADALEKRGGDKNSPAVQLLRLQAKQILLNGQMQADHYQDSASSWAEDALKRAQLTGEHIKLGAKQQARAAAGGGKTSKKKKKAGKQGSAPPPAEEGGEGPPPPPPAGPEGGGEEGGGAPPPPSKPYKEHTGTMKAVHSKPQGPTLFDVPGEGQGDVPQEQAGGEGGGPEQQEGGQGQGGQGALLNWILEEEEEAQEDNFFEEDSEDDDGEEEEEEF